MKLALITSEEESEKEILLLTEMFEKFNFNLHVRKPKFSSLELKNWINKLDKTYHNRMIVHGNDGFNLKANIAGFHKKGKDEWTFGKYTSASCHSFEEVLEAKNKIEYSFLSPIKNSISKKGYNANFTAKELRHFFDQHDVNVYALGGITPSDIKEMRTLGFTGVALMGAIWNAKNPISQLEKAINQCQS